MIRKILIFGVFAASVRGADVPTVWGEPASGFQLGIRLSKPTMELTNLLSVEAILRNTAPTARSITTPHSIENFRLIATDSNNFNVLTRDPLEGHGSVSLGPGAITMEAGEERKVPLDIGMFLQWKHAGPYLLTAVEEIHDLNGLQIVLKSGNAALHLVANDGDMNKVAPGPSKAQVIQESEGNRVSSGTSKQAKGPFALQSPAPPKSNSEVALPLASAPPMSANNSLRPGFKWGMGIIASLLALVLAILWRAVRRKPEG